MAKAEEAAKQLGGMSGKAASSIMQRQKRANARLQDITRQIHNSRRDAQSTDSNNRK